MLGEMSVPFSSEQPFRSLQPRLQAVCAAQRCTRMVAAYFSAEIICSLTSAAPLAFSLPCSRSTAVPGVSNARASAQSTSASCCTARKYAPSSSLLFVSPGAKLRRSCSAPWFEVAVAERQRPRNQDAMFDYAVALDRRPSQSCPPCHGSTAAAMGCDCQSCSCGEPCWHR